MAKLSELSVFVVANRRDPSCDCADGQAARCFGCGANTGTPMTAVARLLGLAKFGVGVVTYAEPPDPVFGRRDRHRGTFGRKDIAMQAKRIALIVLPALLLGATTAAAQIPPPVPPLVPNPNPSSSLVLPAPHEVPVSPVTPGTLPGSTAPGVGDAAGIYATQPMGVFHHHHRRRHYSR